MELDVLVDQVPRNAVGVGVEVAELGEGVAVCSAVGAVDDDGLGLPLPGSWLACVVCREGGRAGLLSRSGDLSTWIYCGARMALVLARSVGLGLSMPGASDRLGVKLLTEPEVAAALQVSIEEVGELFEANRLTSFDLDGEERVPDWQLVKPALPEFGDPSSLLPGLDVLYAAAPQPLLDAAAMTEFMTTPLDLLTIDERVLTPLDWMREGRPLSTIIALFRERRWRQ